MRTTEIGKCTPAIGLMPGIRRPVRMMTVPSTSSRRIRFGDPTSSLPSGVIVAAFSPYPDSRIGDRRLVHDRVLGRAPMLEREVEVRSASGRPITSGSSTRSACSSSS